MGKAQSSQRLKLLPIDYGLKVEKTRLMRQTAINKVTEAAWITMCGVDLAES